MFATDSAGPKKIQGACEQGVKGLFLHTKLIQPRRADGGDKRTPEPWLWNLNRNENRRPAPLMQIRYFNRAAILFLRNGSVSCWFGSL